MCAMQYSAGMLRQFTHSCAKRCAAAMGSNGMMQHMCGAPLQPEHGQAAAVAGLPEPGTVPCRTV